LGTAVNRGGLMWQDRAGHEPFLDDRGSWVDAPAAVEDFIASYRSLLARI